MKEKRKKEQEMVCIVCPEGCKMTVSISANDLKVLGHRCKKGIGFARDECFHPTRILTTTMSIDSEEVLRIPVRSRNGAPKDQILAMIAALRKISLKAPVQMGDVIVSDLLGTGVDIIASASVKR